MVYDIKTKKQQITRVEARQAGNVVKNNTIPIN